MKSTNNISEANFFEKFHKGAVGAFAKKDLEVSINWFWTWLKKLNKSLSNNLVVLIGLSIIVFISYSSLFNSYFESDEWFYFTHYFPLTGGLHGALTAIISTFINADYISGSQHVVPVASLIYFLNTKILGLNFFSYAFMSLLLHSVNSFLVFLFIKALLHKNLSTKNFYAILGAIFFAVSSVPMHAVTWAGFYGQNVLSVTFFLLCILYFKTAFIKERIKFIYYSLIFLFLALFTKESTFFLFLLLPFMALTEERIFPLKSLGKIFLITLMIFTVFRFVIPNISTLPDRIVDSYLSSSPARQAEEAKDTIKITNSEIAFRTITFPVKMTGSLFMPPENAAFIAQLLAPIISPIPPGGDQSIYSAFLYGSGQATILYLTSIAVIIFCIISILKFKRTRNYVESKAIAIGLAMMIFGALPLVAIIFTFPRWGYTTFLDSRHLYNPAIGAAILFPFMVFGVANLISKSYKVKNVLVIVLLVFASWLIYNSHSFDKSVKVFAQNYGEDRREIVKQLKNFLPELPAKTVFYFEKDGKAPFASLPFFTSIPQALSIVYYDVSSLPDSFYSKPLFSGKPEGYQFSNGRGLGFYITQEKLFQDLQSGKFEIDDIYSFYYYGEEAKLKDITPNIHIKMRDYLADAQQNSDWIQFVNSKGTFTLLHPAGVQVREEEGSIQISSSTFNYRLFSSAVSQNFDLNEYLQIQNQAAQGEIKFKKVMFDKLHFNEVGTIQSQFFSKYYAKLNDSLFYFELNEANTGSINVIEKILGSLEIIEKDE